MAKKNSIPALPEIMTMIKQPNRVTSAKYDYTLLQQKVMLFILKQLQEPINELVKDKQKTVQQLELFRASDYVEINIPLKEISKSPSEYKELVQTIQALRKIDLVFEKKDASSGVSVTVYTGLILETIVPQSKYKPSVKITMNHDVAKALVNIDGGYTKYAFEIAFNAKSKYTSRIYQLISRWKDKGGYTVSLDAFRDWLVLGDKYKDWRDLKRRVLDPVREELLACSSDVWFEVDAVKESTIIKSLRFKIITSAERTHDLKLKDNVINMMKMHFNMNGESIDQLRAILSLPVLMPEFQMKLQELHSEMNKRGNIDNVPAYVVASMKNHFKGRF